MRILMPSLSVLFIGFAFFLCACTGASSDDEIFSDDDRSDDDDAVVDDDTTPSDDDSHTNDDTSLADDDASTALDDDITSSDDDAVVDDDATIEPPQSDCVPEGPNGDLECEMLLLVNQARAENWEEAPELECPDPLAWDAHWAAEGRKHSQDQADAGQLYHENFPGGQNCAMTPTIEWAMEQFMNGPGEPPCPELSHHCNIMRCAFTHVGIGIVEQDGYLWITQNFY